MRSRAPRLVLVLAGRGATRAFQELLEAALRALERIEDAERFVVREVRAEVVEQRAEITGLRIAGCAVVGRVRLIGRGRARRSRKRL